MLFYNALNLEHVTENRILNDNEKERAAVKFVDSIGDNITRFQKFFDNKTDANDYKESWELVINDNDWTKSKSNIKFLIDELLVSNEKKEEK
ncbi:MAG: hypothetical protein LBM02_08880 [Lachnospiraceae bacterium]|jgi:hypothetical protein|nr:hypothetical protein [Lachnospiraceae bacterium]